MNIAMPPRITALPVDKHSRPVPFFVAWVDGVPDHRIADAAKRRRALDGQLCWTCGRPVRGNLTFLIGPMCAVNRITAEPGSHRDCATYAARACPFLTTPRMRRRESNQPDGVVEPAGVMIRRNPGVTVAWTTKSFRLVPDGNGGQLLRIGDPIRVDWWAEGRQASRWEVLDSIESGLPALREMAEAEGEQALAELGRMTEAALRLVPDWEAAR